MAETGPGAAFSELIQSFLTQWQEQQTNCTLDEFLTDRLQQRLGLPAGQANEIAGQISETIEAIEAEAQALARARKQGALRAQWLAERLEQLTANAPPAQRWEPVSAIARGMEAANGAFGPAGNGPATGTPILDAVDGALAIVRAAETNTGLWTSLQAETWQTAAPVAAKLADLPSVREALDSAPGSEPERNLKKVVGAAATVAARQGLLPAEKTTPPAVLAGIADRSVSALKIGAMVSADSISLEEGIDSLIDRTVAAATQAVKSVCAEGGAKLGALAGAWAGGLFGPAAAAVGAKAGEAIGRLLGAKVGDWIGTGLQKVGAYAKTLVPNLGSRVRAGLQTLVGWFS